MSDLSLIQDSSGVIFGEGALRRLSTLLNTLEARRIFWVCDRAAVEGSGANCILADCWQGRELRIFSDFQLNPRLEDVKEGIVMFREVCPDLVIAFGGGSAMDMAKLIVAIASADQPPETCILEGSFVVRKKPPLVAVPTTSGTGSEATCFAVVYVDGIKYSLEHSTMRPDYALIDPCLTYSLPPHPTAASGLDALCQAMESVWSVRATEASMAFALEALALASDHLENAVCRPCPDSRSAMARAAHLAGKAINLTRTTAPHAISYGITSRFGFPHGVAVALTIGAFLEYNAAVDEASCADPRGPDAVKERIKKITHVLGTSSPDEARIKLSEIIRKTGCPASFSEAAIPSDSIPGLVRIVNVERMSNNPRRISSENLEALLGLL